MTSDLIFPGHDVVREITNAELPVDVLITMERVYHNESVPLEDPAAQCAWRDQSRENNVIFEAAATRLAQLRGRT